MSLLSVIAGRNRGGGGGVSDTDAQNYITRVETADGASLESGVKDAINQLFIDMKAAAAPVSGSNWDSVVAGTMILLAGPRTIAGLLEPLYPHGTLPANTGFASGDYDRKTGLLGSTGKRIDFRDMSVGGPTIDDHAMAAWVTSLGTSGTARTMLVSGTGAGTTGIRKSGAPGTVTINSANTTSSDTAGISESTYGFYGLSRTNSANFISRVAGASATRTRVSASFSPDLCRAFLRSDNIQGFTGRLKAVFFGKSVDLETLEASLTTYFNAINAAIP